MLKKSLYFKKLLNILKHNNKTPINIIGYIIRINTLYANEKCILHSFLADKIFIKT